MYDIHVFFLPSIFSHSIYLHKCIISKCGTATEPPNCAGSLPQRFWITWRMWTNFLAPWQLSWSDANIFCCSPKDGDILGISYLKNCSQTMYCVSIYIYIIYWIILMFLSSYLFIDQDQIHLIIKTVSAISMRMYCNCNPQKMVWLLLFAGCSGISDTNFSSVLTVEAKFHLQARYKSNKNFYETMCAHMTHMTHMTHTTHAHVTCSYISTLE